MLLTMLNLKLDKKMNAKYVKPKLEINELEMESLLTTQSVVGGVSSPVGVRRNDVCLDDDSEDNDFSGIWGDNGFR